MNAPEQPGQLPARPLWTWIAVGVVIALVAALIGGVIGARVSSGTGSLATGATSSVCNASDVSTAVLPSLVEIATTAGRSGSLGSGSIVDASGTIVTNNHVIDAAASKNGSVTVDLARGESNVPATIVGRDPLTDIAVLQVPLRSLSAITIGSSANLVVGQPVVALGSPLGLTSTVTSGIVSALDRTVNVGSADSPSILLGAIQTDASINPGNSGGPLVDCSGRQVGINSAGASPALTGGGGSVGLNFAIPMDFAMAEVSQILALGHVTHASLGIEGISVTDEVAKNTGLPRGVLVTSVVRTGPADAAGVKPEDVITAVGSTPTPTLSDYLVAVQKLPIGSKAVLTIVRQGRTITISVTVVDATTLVFGQ